MAVPLAKFAQQLEESGIIAEETLRDFLPPRSDLKDAESLARVLIRNKKLTKFQAEEIAKGKGKSLRLGNYVLMERIGAGGMGEVFKAEHRRMKRMVAIKLLTPAMTQDKQAIARFEREVEAAAKLSHPNIVAAHDADFANNVHFLVMELVDGSDLSTLIKKNGVLPVDRAVDYVTQAARGLAAAHAQGIVHRDIKPANLLLDKTGTVKILDMGLARLHGAEEGRTQAELTASGAVMGTVDYMAPEQALSSKSADARADIYGLGCSLFYLLAGKPIYEGETLMSKLLAHRDQAIPSLRVDRPEVSESLDSIFQKMVAKNVHDRYQTMSEVLAELAPLQPAAPRSANDQKPAAAIEVRGSRNATAIGERTFVPGDDVQSPSANSASETTRVVRAFRHKHGIPIWRNAKVIVGAGCVGLAALAITIVLLKMKDRMLVLDANRPTASVQHPAGEGGVENTQTISEKTASVGRKSAAELSGEVDGQAQERMSLGFELPGFDQWVKEVATFPAAEQVEAVRKKLVELNPTFDGKIEHSIENGVVSFISITSNNIADVSPLRALTRLSFLDFRTSRSATIKLSNLAPLEGLPLKTLAVQFTEVSDLSPLRGMKLTRFYGGGTKLVDLAPLKGMPLVVLSISNTQVADLTPLQGMKLSEAFFNNTKVHDLSPLEGMPLTAVNVQWTPVTDLSPLRGAPIKELHCNFNPERDTALLRSMKTLQKINDTPVTEFWREVDGR